MQTAIVALLLLALLALLALRWLAYNGIGPIAYITIRFLFVFVLICFAVAFAGFIPWAMYLLR